MKFKPLIYVWHLRNKLGAGFSTNTRWCGINGAKILFKLKNTFSNCWNLMSLLKHFCTNWQRRCAVTWINCSWAVSSGFSSIVFFFNGIVLCLYLKPNGRDLKNNAIKIPLPFLLQAFVGYSQTFPAQGSPSQGLGAIMTGFGSRGSSRKAASAASDIQCEHLITRSTHIS